MFTVSTPRRCFGNDRSSPSVICAERAIWMLPAVNGLAAQFFCDAHRRDGVVPIATDAPFRRVALKVEVLISAAALTPAAAHSEAVNTVLHALGQVGGVPSLVDITSAIGRYAVPPPVPATKPRQGSRV